MYKQKQENRTVTIFEFMASREKVQDFQFSELEIEITYKKGGRRGWLFFYVRSVLLPSHPPRLDDDSLHKRFRMHSQACALHEKLSM